MSIWVLSVCLSTEDVFSFPCVVYLLIFSVKRPLCIQYMSPASGGFDPDPHRGSAAGPHWGTSVPRLRFVPPPLSKFLVTPLDVYWVHWQIFVHMTCGRISCCESASDRCGFQLSHPGWTSKPLKHVRACVCVCVCDHRVYSIFWLRVLVILAVNAFHVLMWRGPSFYYHCCIRKYQFCVCLSFRNVSYFFILWFYLSIESNIFSGNSCYVWFFDESQFCLQFCQDHCSSYYFRQRRR